MYGYSGQGPQPHVPVEPLGQRLGREVLVLAHAAAGDVRQFHVADQPGVDHLECLAVLGRVALLQPGLEHAIVPPHGVDHRAGLPDRQRDRLFTVHVLACLGRADGDRRVPPFAGDDDHGVDVVAGQQLAEVVVRLEAVEQTAGLFRTIGSLQPLGRVVAAPRVDVAQGDQLHVVVARENAEMAASHHADADRTDRDPVAGRRRAVGPQHGAANHQRGGDRTGGNGRATGASRVA